MSGYKKTCTLGTGLFYLCGETGTRTPATVARRQFSKLLHYHSGTSPEKHSEHSQSEDKVTIKHCQNKKNTYLTRLT